MRKLRVIVGRYYERKEFPAKLGTAICTIVKVKGKSYGYCTYLFLLIPSGTKRWAVFDRMSTEERGKLLAQKQNIMEQRRKVMWRNEVERKRERREAMRKKARGLVRDSERFFSYFRRFLDEARRRAEKRRTELKARMAAEEEARKAEEEEEKKRAVYELEDGPPVVVYLDLQQIRCGDDVAGSLCSEYCCDFTRRDSIFCDSKLECF